MNMCKVYTAEGNVVASFTKIADMNGCYNTNHRIKLLNKKGYYVKRQLSAAVLKKAKGAQA